MKRFYNWLRRLFGFKPKIGTFDKWIFPVITNMAPDGGDLIDKLISVQPMTAKSGDKGLSLFIDRPSKPPIPEFWKAFVDKRKVGPIHPGLFKIGEEGKYKGHESYVSGGAITHVLKIPDPQAFVEAHIANIRYHRDDLPEDDKLFQKGREGIQRFVDLIQPGDVVCHYRCGGLLSMRDGLVILRKSPEGEWLVQGSYLLMMS